MFTCLFHKSKSGIFIVFFYHKMATITKRYLTSPVFKLTFEARLHQKKLTDVTKLGL